MILETTERGYEEVIRHRDAEITRLRALVKAKDKALDQLLCEVPYSNDWDAIRQQAKAALSLGVGA